MNTWHDIDLDALEAELVELGAEADGDAPLTPSEVEDIMAVAAVEILTLTAELEAARAELSRRAQAVRPIQDALAAASADVRRLKTALTSAEARAQEADARASAAAAEAASLRAELEDVRAQAPAWVAVRDHHLADLSRRAL